MSSVLGHLLIIGFMGSGKSTLGCLTALRCKFPLFDSDIIAEQRMGITVGEQLVSDSLKFRLCEGDIIVHLTSLRKGILVLGGGAIESSTTRFLLKGKPVVFLDPGVDICWQRVQSDTQHRPLATDYDSFVALYKKRLPLYLSVCRWHITDNLPPEQLLHKLESIIQQDNTPMD